MAKSNKYEGSMEFEEKFGVDPDDTMMLTDEEYAKAFGIWPEESDYEPDDDYTELYVLDATKKQIVARMQEIDAEIIQTEKLINETKDRFQKQDFEQDRLELIREKYLLSERLTQLENEIQDLTSPGMGR